MSLEQILNFSIARAKRVLPSGLDTEIEKKLVILLLICFTHIPPCIVIIFLGWFIDSPGVMALAFSAVMAFTIPLIFVGLRKPMAARVAFVLLVNTVSFLTATFLPTATGGYLYYYNTLSAPLLLFTPSETRLLKFSYIVPVLGLLFFFFFGEAFFEKIVLSQTQVQFMFVTNATASFIFLMGVGISLHLTYAYYQKAMDEQRAALTATAKLSALGEMAGGIAHEINNPLAIIALRADQLVALANDPSPDIEKLQNAAKAQIATVKRIESIIRAMRNFSRDGVHDPVEKVKCCDILDEAKLLCETRFQTSGIDFELNCAARDQWFECRQVQVVQVLVNLLNNSYDAVMDVQKRKIQVQSKISGSYVIFSVTDNGPGIPKEIQEKILQPFFTTKEVGKGTGLGLSVSRAIAKSMNGDLYFESEGGETSFYLKLPITHQAVG